MVVLEKNLEQWFKQYPLLKDMVDLHPTSWFNSACAPVSEALDDVGLVRSDIDEAAARLQRFSPFIAQAFPETTATNGIIESPLLRLTKIREIFNLKSDTPIIRNLWLKADNALPISGSVKARGGIYEVLKHAEDIALAAGLLALNDDYRLFGSPQIKELLKNRKITVGSTGNLGLSIGIISAKLGFQTYVHMSADAKQWKKDKLRANGVQVIEYQTDYGKAVEEGRRQANGDPNCYFIDDENSRNLFLGYSVAAQRLAKQFEDADIRVDAEHPLFVYLPCGVGGGPGGISFGLKCVFGDNVHCIFAEPTHSPAMFLGVYTGLHDKVSVQDFGIDNKTAADGLAVGRPSGFVGKAMQRLIDGYYTVEDKTLFSYLAQLYNSENIKLEPSAAAGFAGIPFVLQNKEYLERQKISQQDLQNATHLVWATGGAMVPDDEFQRYLAHANKNIL
ncbi:D-serine ammonia-lyase [Bartonella sp. HY329]|uniref:D-serine ammonia-lyase n=1 Tax=unclassified Bartonella TaxID=2645622 RepID=UPI0021C9D7C1|nr:MULTISPECIES: D-serine ammonia-lyase [unclassified Bartonella]UXM95141.1 D-serine ammonia-lyase [Bartonella sp. HY329]UXN09464.1 D-serine ammonia-lyase [Bartonella sp. HY328]